MLLFPLTPPSPLRRGSGNRRGRTSAADAHPRHLRLPPVGARLEAGTAPAEGLGLFEDRVDRRLDVERLRVGLGGVPRGVDEELDAVALRVREVDRPRIAVGDDAELLDPLLA